MLIAQAYGEYGANALAAAFQSAFRQAEAFIGGLGTKEYVAIVAAGVVLYILFGKRG